MACSSSLAPLRQLQSLAGQEHGRTIPLPETGPMSVALGVVRFRSTSFVRFSLIVCFVVAASKRFTRQI
jgi:hypothetical protein